MLHFMRLIPQDTGIVASDAQTGFTRVNRLIAFVRIENQPWKRIRFAILKPGMEKHVRGKQID